jgi:hypothetical protein
MTLQPGETTLISMQFNMHGIEMGGIHDFRLHIPTNDPDNLNKTLAILSNWIP